MIPHMNINITLKNVICNTKTIAEHLNELIVFAEYSRLRLQHTVVRAPYRLCTHKD